MSSAEDQSLENAIVECTQTIQQEWMPQLQGRFPPLVIAIALFVQLFELLNMQVRARTLTRQHVKAIARNLERAGSPNAAAESPLHIFLNDS